MEYATAKAISDVMLDVSEQLNQSVVFIQKHTKDEEEFIKYRRAVGAIMATIWEEVIHPLYTEHPDLKPHKST
jgi:uncharacterized protein (UPF0305 family)